MDLFYDESGSRAAMRAYLQPMFTGSGDHDEITLEAMRAHLQPLFAGNDGPSGASREVDVDSRHSISKHESKTASASSKSAAETEVQEYLVRTEELLKYCDQLEIQLQDGWLRDENEALEAQVLQMQEDFLALQEDFRSMKEYLGQRIAELGHELDKQTVSVEGSERRAICLEDLVRFHEEQQGLITKYWRVQCDHKDESIKFFNKKLTEYTVDSQYLGVVEKRTEASISHEFQCLRDRHDQLQNEFDRRMSQQEQLSERLAAIQKGIEINREQVPSSRSACSPLTHLNRLKAEQASLHWKLSSLREVKASMDAVAGEAPEDTVQLCAASWPHVCIWRDELEVRAQQLEKITSQLGATNHSLHLTNGELGRQCKAAEDLRSQYDQALSQLHMAETQTEAWHLQCAQSERTVEELRSLVSRKLGELPSSWDHRSMPLDQRIAEIKRETQYLVEAKRKPTKDGPSDMASERET